MLTVPPARIQLPEHPVTLPKARRGLSLGVLPSPPPPHPTETQLRGDVALATSMKPDMNKNRTKWLCSEGWGEEVKPAEWWLGEENCSWCTKTAPSTLRGRVMREKGRVGRGKQAETSQQDSDSPQHRAGAWGHQGEWELG